MGRLLLLATMLGWQSAALAQEQLTAAAAADLQPVLKEVAALFEKETGKQVKLTFGSSGTFFSQIQNGAPYDLFFSADVSYPEKLAASGLTEPGSLYRYAIGRIVLWTPTGTGIDVSRGLRVTADPAVRKLAIANPAHAPYGRAAEVALKKQGLWEMISPKLVMGENISQAAQFVQSGNAEVGILALSFVLAPSMKDQGKYYEIPQELYPPLLQAVVVLNTSKHKRAAQSFVDFMKRAEIRSLLSRSGFRVDETTP